MRNSISRAINHRNGTSRRVLRVTKAVNEVLDHARDSALRHILNQLLHNSQDRLATVANDALNLARGVIEREMIKGVKA